jgi:hypothetical protein
LTKIPREDNARADALSKLGSRTDQVIKASTYKVIIQAEPSIALRQDMKQVDEAPTNLEWATEIIQYLQNGLLLEDKARSQKVKL